MRMPGFTAEIVLSQTNNYYRLAAGGSFLSNRKTTVTRRALLDAQSAVVPAQIDWESRFLSSRGGVRRRLEDRPVCPLGEQAVWVSRGLTDKCCQTEVRVWDHDLMRYIYVKRRVCDWQRCGGWEPAFTGWECQSAFRVVA